MGLGVLLAGIGILLGGYLFFRPRAYKEEMGRLGHLFGDFPLWAIRLLGVFLIVFGACISYLFLTKSK
jgi:hypothetical protein